MQETSTRGIVFRVTANSIKKYLKEQVEVRVPPFDIFFDNFIFLEEFDKIKLALQNFDIDQVFTWLNFDFVDLFVEIFPVPDCALSGDWIAVFAIFVGVLWIGWFIVILVIQDVLVFLAEVLKALIFVIGH